LAWKSLTRQYISAENPGRQNERCLGPSQNVDRLECLWLEAVVDVDDQDGDVGQCPAPSAKRRKRVVARRVDEQQSGQVEIIDLHERTRHTSDRIQRHGRRADMLGDRPRLTVDDGAATDTVEQARLPMVDVPEHRHDRRPQPRGRFVRLVLCVCVGHPEPSEKLV
jgi:hypothetical protein